MRYTNQFNLPAPYVRAVGKSSYDKGEADFSVTELSTPPRLSQLVKRHDSELVEDVSTRLWVLGGTVAHEILERAGNEEKELFEKRLYATVSGKKIGGKLDSLCLVSGLLTDFKWTSSWTYVFGRSEWIEQTNMYAFLARENGFKVTALEIFAMYRDWSETTAMRSSDYPKLPTMRVPIEMWPHEKTREFIAERVLLHETAKTTADDFLLACTPEERWMKATTWAVMKPGRKSAVSVHETFEAAKQVLSHNVMGAASIVERLGVSRRCESYCPVGKDTNICSWWKENRPKVEEAVGAAG